MPEVSVVIPCYNQGEWLMEAVNSVLMQTFTDYEIIIVNDGSTDDNTNRIISGYKNDRIRVEQTINMGLPSARNNGISCAEGRYILPLDSDNKISENYLEKCMNIFGSRPETDIIYTDAIYFGKKEGLWQQSEISFPLMLHKNLVDACAIFKKSVWDVCGGYKKNMEHGWEDWDLWLTAHELKMIFYHLKEPLFFYRVGERSMRDQIALLDQRRLYLEQQLVTNHLALYREYYPAPLTMLREMEILKQEKDMYESYKRAIMNSASYRLGHMLLKPFKWVKNKMKSAN